MGRRCFTGTERCHTHIHTDTWNYRLVDRCLTAFSAQTS